MSTTPRPSAEPAPRGLPRRVATIVLLLGGSAVAARGDDRQPNPPRVFFPEPDATTWAELEPVIDGSFADVNKAPVARDVLVRRYGVWALAPLLRRLETDANQAVSWNALLTIGSLRRTLGPSSHLWPAIPVLERFVRSGGEAYRRAFACLALGEFYGPGHERTGPGSREGTRTGFEAARRALASAQEAIAGALDDDSAFVRTAAALALGKIGGVEAASRLRLHLERTPGVAHGSARAARIVASGLLGAPDDPAVLAAAKDGAARQRAAAALAIAVWATSHVQGDGLEPPGVASTRAVFLDTLVDGVRNTAIRTGEDGAEAIFARGALAHVTGRPGPWDDVLRVASAPSSEERAAVAATQALLFCPPQAAARRLVAEWIGREESGKQRPESVVAGFLVIAGSDGTAAGVRACREFLGNRAREPRGRVERDVRFHAIVGLVRALEAGRLEGAERVEALRALGDASKTLLAVEPGERSFRSVLEDVLGRGRREALAADPVQRATARERELLEEALDDPDVMDARDPIDTTLDRLNDFAWLLFGLDGVKPAASGGIGSTGPRQPRTDDEPERFLIAWLQRGPYFTRLDLHRERGTVPAVVPPPRDPTLEIDR